MRTCIAALCLSLLLFLQSCDKGTFLNPNCDIPAPVISYNEGVELGEYLRLFADTIPGASYIWYGPDGYYSYNQNPSMEVTDKNVAGEYTAKAVIEKCTSAVSTIYVQIGDATPKCSPKRDTITFEDDIHQPEHIAFSSPELVKDGQGRVEKIVAYGDGTELYIWFDEAQTLKEGTYYNNHVPAYPSRDKKIYIKMRNGDSSGGRVYVGREGNMWTFTLCNIKFGFDEFSRYGNIRLYVVE